MLGEYNPESHPVTFQSRTKSNSKDPYIGMSKDEIESFIKSLIPSQPTQSQQITQSASPQYRPQPAGTYKNISDENIGKLIQWLNGETPDFIPVSKSLLSPKPKRLIKA